MNLSRLKEVFKKAVQYRTAPLLGVTVGVVLDTILPTVFKIQSPELLFTTLGLVGGVGIFAAWYLKQKKKHGQYNY